MALDITDNPAPGTEHAAKFSIQHAVAVALLDGAAGLEQFRPARLADPELAALRARVVVRAAPEFNAAYPQAWPARVRVRLAGGATLEETVAVPRGMPGNPMSDEELREKFLALVTPVLSSERGALLAQAVACLGDGLPVRELLRACRTG